MQNYNSGSYATTVSVENKNRYGATDETHEAMDNAMQWLGYYAFNNDDARYCINFVLKNMWSAVEQQEYKKLRKPMLTFNKILPQVMQILSEQRQLSAEIKVRCLSPDATEKSEKMTEMMADLIRSYVYSSDSNTHYQYCFQWMLLGGYGALKVRADYEEGLSFVQRPFVEACLLPECCFWDRSARRMDKTDGNFCGEFIIMSRESFSEKFPEFADDDGFQLPANYYKNYLFNAESKTTIVLLDYYERKYFKRKIVLLSNGKTMPMREFRALEAQLTLKNLTLSLNNQPPSDVPYIVEKRTVTLSRIYHKLMTKNNTIEKTLWPISDLPLIYVDGNGFMVEGRWQTKSFVKNAIDAQRFHNVIGSDIVQMVKSNRREQWVGTPQNVAGDALQEMWQNPEVQQGILLATPDPVTGQLPQKIMPAMFPPAILTQFERSETDVMNTLGRYEANQGMQGNERSGVAIQNRAKQGDQSVYVYKDNLNSGIERVGKIMLALIPKIMDSERTVMATKQDGTQYPAEVNKYDPQQGDVQNDLTQGQYDISIDVDGDDETQRANAVQQLMLMYQASPQNQILLGDLVAQNLDLENAGQVATRMRTLVPPEVLAAENGTPLPPAPPEGPDPQVQALLMQAQASLLSAQAQMKKASAEEYKWMFEVQRIKMEEQRDSVAASVAQNNMVLGRAEVELQAAQINHNMSMDIVSAMNEAQKTSAAITQEINKQVMSPVQLVSLPDNPNPTNPQDSTTPPPPIQAPPADAAGVGQSPQQ